MYSIELKTGWLYETIVSVWHDDRPHAAPFGIRMLTDQSISLKLFKGSLGLLAILSAGAFVVNITEEIPLFYTALWEKDQLSFTRAQTIDAPVLEGVPAVLESVVTHTEDLGKQVNITAEICHREIQRPVKPINRAPSLVLESTILATRRHLIPKERFEATIKENARVVSKVAPGSAYEATMCSLLGMSPK